jgi:hypothetical protein
LIGGRNLAGGYAVPVKTAPYVMESLARDAWPAARSVITWNASENRHMLAINISLGFKPAGFEGEWQKRLE